MRPPTTSPPATSRPGARAGRAPRPVRLPPWGWLEWFVVGTQLLFPALLFIPGISVFRLLNRAATYVISLMALYSVSQGRRRPPTTFPSIPWLWACVAWLALSFFHPTTNSPLAGLASVGLYLTVMSPAFWAPSALGSPRQIRRLVLLVFACNALSATLGLAQVYRPGTFNPPYIPALASGDEMQIGKSTYKADDGRTIMRPCGLADTPGAASISGVGACVFGLAVALVPLPAWQRAAGVGMSLIGLAVIYYTQVRTAMVLTLVGVLALAGLLLLRREVRRATLLLTSLAILGVLAALWVMRNAGEAAIARFLTLFEQPTGQLYYSSRGNMLEHAFNTLLWQFPLGAGLGRYGQVYDYFGDKGPMAPGMIWAEVQWPAWILDGGIPLMVGYAIAIGLAMADSIRIALTSRDRELGYWAAVVCAANLGIIAICFSAVPFLANTGMNFWLLCAALHEADRRTRAAGRARPRPRPAPRPA